MEEVNTILQVVKWSYIGQSRKHLQHFPTLANSSSPVSDKSCWSPASAAITIQYFFMQQQLVGAQGREQGLLSGTKQLDPVPKNTENKISGKYSQCRYIGRPRAATRDWSEITNNILEMKWQGQGHHQGTQWLKFRVGFKNFSAETIGKYPLWAIPPLFNRAILFSENFAIIFSSWPCRDITTLLKERRSCNNRVHMILM